MNKNYDPFTGPRPELLAPAGSPACAMAAYEAGADAIYAGLSRFNARERGENFTSDSMGRIIEFFHKHQRKVYITLNTLIKEKELPDILELLAMLQQLRPDAILVQDLGIINIVKKYFPDLVLHGSTQMGFHNSAGLKLAAELGLKRVVLERQVTMAEIENMDVPEELEIETFVHGALCCSLSGSCLFSSWLGGASGNRGKCKQPCRRRYYSKNGNGFFFSPGDLAAMELLPDFRRLGIASLKIEGRLRQPDYVTNVVSAYNKLLNAGSQEEFDAVISEARNQLSKTCGRRWTTGFYGGTPAFKSLIRADAIGAAGLRCGEVEAVRDNGFGLTATKRLHIGDRIRIQPKSGDEGPALTLTKMFVLDHSVKIARPGDRVFICCDKSIPLNGTVFKIGESFQDWSGKVSALPPMRMALDLSIKVSKNNFHVDVLNFPDTSWEAKTNFATADKHPATAEMISAEFNAADSDEYKMGSCEVDFDGKYFIPAAVLKKIRRDFYAEILPNLDKTLVNDGTSQALGQFFFDYQKQSYPELPAELLETVALKPNGCEPGNRRAHRAKNIFDIDKNTDEAILPDFMPEDKLPSLRRAISRAIDAGIRRFRVTSLYGITLLKDYEDKNLFIVSGYPLPVTNSQSVSMLQQLGFQRATAHIELERESIESMREHSQLPLELYRFGRPALLTTRSELPISGPFKDARENRFELRKGPDGLSRIYPVQVFSIPRLPGMYDFYDLSNADWRSKDLSDFNFNSELN